MGSKLPELNRKRTRAFFEHFSKKHEFRGNVVTGISIRDLSYTVHIEHGSLGMRQDQFKWALRWMGISREEFDAWYKR